MANSFVNIYRDTLLLLPPDLRDWVPADRANRGASTLARGFLCGTGTQDGDLAGKSARAPVRTNAEW